MLPLLSIVIPTRNRQYYLASVIKGILSINSNDFELVIHDNSDARELDAFLDDNKSDSRLRYIYASDTISSMDNFDRAFRQARGEYICTIGDDDFVNPEIVKFCHWAKQNSLDAISDGRWGTQYFWPGFGTENPLPEQGGWLQIQEFTGKMEFLDPEIELKRCAVSGGMSLQRLPRPYLGIIRRECLVAAMDAIGQAPLGTCPDMFYAVAVASHINRLCVFDYPLIIAGYSRAGAGQLIALKRHQGKIEDSPHLRARKNFIWPESIPRFYSEYTFYAESAMRGLQATRRSDLIGKFNIPFLVAMCMLKFPEFRAECIQSLKATFTERKLNTLAALIYFIANLNSAALMLITKRLQSKKLRPGVSEIIERVDNVNCTEDAMKVLTEYLHKTGNSIDHNLSSITDYRFR